MSFFDVFLSTPIKLNFLDNKFDFDISPNHFLEWLKLEGEEISGDYEHDVTSMCEYSCLYISMLLYNTKLKGDMRVYYGNVGISEHYWIGYKIDNKEYFIDLTYKQFDKDAPRLTITEKMNEQVNGGYSFLSEGTPIKEYVDQKEGFEFYTNPITMENPPISFSFNSSYENPFGI